MSIVRDGDLNKVSMRVSNFAKIFLVALEAAPELKDIFQIDQIYSYLICNYKIK